MPLDEVMWSIFKNGKWQVLYKIIRYIDFKKTTFGNWNEDKKQTMMPTTRRVIF